MASSEASPRSSSTTLAGEGLQHQDGTSLLWAGTVPNCKS
ncbi:MAG: hypothetical protein ACO3NL_12365, partial [Phycisphaerales bacterium]